MHKEEILPSTTLFRKHQEWGLVKLDARWKHEGEIHPTCGPSGAPPSQHLRRKISTWPTQSNFFKERFASIRIWGFGHTGMQLLNMHLRSTNMVANKACCNNLSCCYLGCCCGSGTRGTLGSEVPAGHQLPYSCHSCYTCVLQRNSHDSNTHATHGHMVHLVTA